MAFTFNFKRARMFSPFYIFIIICILIPTAYYFGDYQLLWKARNSNNYYYNLRDYYIIGLCIAPSILGHLATIWGHYYRSEREFQHSITKVTTPASVNQRISIWERHIWGCTVKYWTMVFVTVLLNLVWFILPLAEGIPGLVRKSGKFSGISRAVGIAGGYAAMACCAMTLFLVLRRSMLNAIGFTYDEILPLHRWIGVAIVFWSTVHTVGYLMFFGALHSLQKNINLSDIGNGTTNMMGVFAYAAVCVLGLGSIPQIRRRCYLLFMSTHRFMTVVFLVGTITHYPSPMLWYYVLPSMILFLVDRFVPKMMMARTILPEATCSLNVDSDIVRMTFTSPEPMKPYYPGDFILVQIPEIGTLYHPFTIASYWPEDPHSITLFIRVYDNLGLSWTHSLAKLCGNEDKRIRIKANVDGVFGDRRHNYLKSETMIIFVAGAAITTCTALIKAIAAQIASSEEPLSMKLHLVCTFRTRSELHAYGSFLHQITRDPRFTSWLHVQIYVSRPDKSQTLMGSHAHVVKNDIQVPGPTNEKEKKKHFKSLKRTGTMIKRAFSGRTVVTENEKSQPHSQATSSVGEDDTTVKSKDSSLSGSIHTIVDLDDSAKDIRSKSSEKNHLAVATGADEPMSTSPTRAMTYVDQPLPTFQASNSTAVATRFAKLDLFVTAFLILVPLAAWCGARTVPWEGPSNWCPTNKSRNGGISITGACQWTYAMVPGVLHIVVASVAGYFAVWMARTILLRRGSDAEKALPYPDFAVEDERLAVEDGNWDEGDVVYSRGRLDVKKAIQGFVDAGVGKKDKGHGLVTVFGGGPEGFVNMVEKQVKLADWTADYHCESWAP